MGDPLGELAYWTGVSLEELGDWQRLGLLPAEPDRPLAERLERVRLIQFAISRGYRAERLAEIALVHGDMVGQFAEQIAELAGEPVCTLEEAAHRAGIDSELLGRMLSASGSPDERVATEAEIEASGLIKATLDNGLPPEVLSQILRVFSDSTNKIADAAVRLFHLYVHEQLRAGGEGGAELLQATNAIAAPLLPLVEPTVIYFYRKAWQLALREDMMLHLAEELTAPSSIPGEFTRAILFADLSSFTPLTEIMGDSAAASVVARFSDIVRAAAAQHSGQIVKQIGDEFMLVFPDGRQAVHCGLEIRKSIGAESRFPAVRIGAHFGSVLYREGDYVGTSVNLAARVTGAALRNQFLVTDAVRQQVAGLEFEIVPVGARSLKGLSQDIDLFEVLGHVDSAKVADPVCGMQLDDRSSEAQLNWEGQRMLFCSEVCLRRFLENPGRYIKTTQPDA